VETVRQRFQATSDVQELAEASVATCPALEAEIGQVWGVAIDPVWAT
jgi:hypothetical protein